MSFSANIILDSTNPHNGIRLITSELTYPRFIHAEFMTHRLFSRNAASSRAIPTRKMIKMVEENPAMPVHWGLNKRGMAAEESLNRIEADRAERIWLAARNEATEFAKQFRKLGLHKQITNRILEPWKWMTVICSTTQTSNFMALRNHEDAQPEIQEVAKLWSGALEDSVSVEREWHLPYVQDDEQDLDLETKLKVSTARCARVSYLTHNGTRSIDKDLELHERLLTGSGFGHWSAFEHPAQATDFTAPYYDFVKKTFVEEPIRCGNFQGWIQYRKTHRGECQ